jgi:hypothetical protein
MPVPKSIRSTAIIASPPTEVENLHPKMRRHYASILLAILNNVKPYLIASTSSKGVRLLHPASRPLPSRLLHAHVEHSALPFALALNARAPFALLFGRFFYTVKQWPRLRGTFALCTVIRCVSRSLKSRTLCGTCAGRFRVSRCPNTKRREVAAHECFSFAEPMGLEPATSGVTGRRSNGGVCG